MFFVLFSALNNFKLTDREIYVDEDEENGAYEIEGVSKENKLLLLLLITALITTYYC